MFAPAITRNTPELVTTTSPVDDGMVIPAPAATEETALVAPSMFTVTLPSVSELASTPAPVKLILAKSAVMFTLSLETAIPADTVGITH